MSLPQLSRAHAACRSGTERSPTPLQAARRPRKGRSRPGESRCHSADTRSATPSPPSPLSRAARPPPHTETALRRLPGLQRRAGPKASEAPPTPQSTTQRGSSRLNFAAGTFTSGQERGRTNHRRAETGTAVVAQCTTGGRDIRNAVWCHSGAMLGGSPATLQLNLCDPRRP